MAGNKQENALAALDYMARDYDSLLRAMRERIPGTMPEWIDHTSEADFGNVLLELFAHMGDVLSYYQDRVATESFLSTARTRRSVIEHLRLIGYSLATAAPASAMLTVLFPKDYAGTVTIAKGDAFATKSTRDRPSVRFEYVGDAKLEIVCDEDTLLTEDPSTKQKYLFYGPDPFKPPFKPETRKLPLGIPVEEGRLVASERLGVSSGMPNQRFSLAHPRMILRPPPQESAVNRDLTLLVEHGHDIKRWTLRNTLAFSRAAASPSARNGPGAQPDFVVEIDADDRAEIAFGDGDFGQIPRRDAIIKATYRVGGGVIGNVPRHSINTIANAPQLSLIPAQVINADPATGGAERESIEHAVNQAPAVFRSRKRAVTREDYEALARNFPGIGKVRAVATNWNVVTLHVAPAGGGGQISDVLKHGLLAHFEDKRPITTRIEIGPVDYVPIYVKAEVGIEGYYDWDDVKTRVQIAARRLLKFDEVGFNHTLYLSKFYEAIEAVDGVRYVKILIFSRGSVSKAVEGMVETKENEIPCIPSDKDYSEGISIEQGRNGRELS